jgi:hypothetical protein
VEGSACKELVPNAMPRPAAFSISTIPAALPPIRDEPKVGFNFVSLPIVDEPFSLEEVEKRTDVTIQRIPAPPNQVIQQNHPSTAQPLRARTHQNEQVRMPTPVQVQSYVPPSKIQAVSNDDPRVGQTTGNLDISTTKSNLIRGSIPRQPGPQVGQRKPGPGRGRPRKYPLQPTVASGPGLVHTSMNPNVDKHQNESEQAGISSFQAALSAVPLPMQPFQHISGLLPQASSKQPQQPIIRVGPYCRPKVNVKSENVNLDDVANLVMPTEDWSVNVYPSPNPEKKGSQILTISETMLNSDKIEIVRKSITVHSNWAMKFSIMSRDMSHFNIGLGTTDISDLQAVLDNFSSLPFCKGLTESITTKIYQSLSPPVQIQTERFVDNVYRSINCPLLIVDLGASKVNSTCASCLRIWQSIINDTKTQKQL